MRKLTLECLDEAIEELERIRGYIRCSLETESTSVNDIVCREYIEVQNVARVAKEMNERGLSYNSRKFIGKDISYIIRDSTDSELGHVANAIFKYNNKLQNGSTSIKSVLKNLEGDVK